MRIFMQINAMPTFRGLIKGTYGPRQTFAINTDRIIRMKGDYTDDARIFKDKNGNLQIEPVKFYSTRIYFDNETEICIPHKITNVIEAYKKVAKDQTAVVNLDNKA